MSVSIFIFHKYYIIFSLLFLKPIGQEKALGSLYIYIPVNQFLFLEGHTGN